MSADRKERQPFWRRNRERIKGPLSVEEFMEIRDPSEAKSLIGGVLRSKLKDNYPDGMLSGQEISNRIELFHRAFDFAALKHIDKNRLTGEKYIFHPAAVTYMVALDKRIPIDKLHIALAASMCHDVLEDTPTLPSELRAKIEPEATGYVILLSKKMKAMKIRPNNFALEMANIEKSTSLSADQEELKKWVDRRKGSTISATAHIYFDEILKGPDIVKRIKMRDRQHNLMTLPPAYQEGRSAEDQIKVDNIRAGIHHETRQHFYRIALSLEFSDGLAVYRSLRRANNKAEAA